METDEVGHPPTTGHGQLVSAEGEAGDLVAGLERGMGVAHGGKSRRVVPRLSVEAREKKKRGGRLGRAMKRRRRGRHGAGPRGGRRREGGGSGAGGGRRRSTWCCLMNRRQGMCTG
jgi:hypothetical protein